MSTIITRNSTNSGSTPSSLIQGELAINVTDGRLFYGSGSGNVVKEFTASGSGGGAIDTGSFATTGSNIFIGNQIITGSLHQSGTFYPDQIDWFSSSIGYDTGSYILTTTINGLTTYAGYGDVAVGLAPYIPTVSSSVSASYAETASYAPAYLPLTGGTINGNVTVNGTASIAFLNVTYESASVIYSSGSNQFGDASNDVQTLWGTVDIKSGPVLVTGSVIANSFTGSLLGTASYATNALSASYAPDTTFPYTGSARITGSLSVSGSIIARNSTATANSLARWSGSAGGLLTLTGSILNSNNTQVWVGTNNPNTLVTIYPTTSSIVTGLSVYSPYGINSYGTYTQGNQVGIQSVALGSSTTAYGGYFTGQDTATTYGVYSTVAITEFGSITTGIGGYFDGRGDNAYAVPTNAYSVQLVDGTQGVGKVLVSQTSDGKANWAQTVNSASVAVTASFARTALSSSYALSASYAPSTPPFPYTGSALITGSLGVTGSMSILAYTASTATIFNVRNSANTANILTAQGDSEVNIRQNLSLGLYNAGATRKLYMVRDAETYGLDIDWSGASTTGVRIVNNGSGTNTALSVNSYNGTTNYAIIAPNGDIVASAGKVVVGTHTATAKLDVKAGGALSTDLAFRVRNSADTANLGAIYGNGTVNLGDSNFNFQSTETSGRTAVIGSSNTGASYNTYSILSILGHNNNIIGYGHTSYVGINSSITQNSGGTVTGMGESNTLLGGTIGIGMNNNIAGSANSNMNTGIGYNNAIQYEKTNTFLLGNNLRVSAAGAASMTKIGWANSAGTLAQIDRSFEVYLNGQSGSDFHVTGKTNVVLKNNSVLVSGTNYEAAATNTLTIHNGVAPITNIAGAFQLYSTASSAGNAKPYFRTENGTTVWLGDESRLFNVTASRTIISSSQNTISGSSLTVYGSGSAQPVFTVQGSQGELFSITDSLSGSLFSVNDISGLPIMEVFSDNTTLMGSYLAPSLNTTAKVVQTNSGSFTMYSLPTASYDTAFFEYSVRSGSNARAGIIMAIQSGSAVNFTETTTTDFGSTSAVSFTVIVTGSNIALTGSSTSGAWTIKTIVRSI